MVDQGSEARPRLLVLERRFLGFRYIEARGHLFDPDGEMTDVDGVRRTRKGRRTT